MIRFEQIYGLYDLTEMSDRVARKKKCIVRSTVKTVLDHYKKRKGNNPWLRNTAG